MMVPTENDRTELNADAGPDERQSDDLLSIGFRSRIVWKEWHRGSAPVPEKQSPSMVWLTIKPSDTSFAQGSLERQIAEIEENLADVGGWMAADSFPCIAP